MDTTPNQRLHEYLQRVQEHEQRQFRRRVAWVVGLVSVLAVSFFVWHYLIEIKDPLTPQPVHEELGWVPSAVPTAVSDASTATPEHEVRDWSDMLFPAAFVGRKGQYHALEACSRRRATSFSASDYLECHSERHATFPGGRSAMREYIRRELVYPTDAIEAEVEGMVLVTFQVDGAGRISQARVKSDPVGYGCDESALQLVTRMPQWLPATRLFLSEPVIYTIPVYFKLHDDASGLLTER